MPRRELEAFNGAAPRQGCIRHWRRVRQLLGPANAGDVARTALFLASDDTAMMTGIVLPRRGRGVGRVISGSGEKMKRLQGKVAVVTGATSGIGETTARLFAREGAKVAIAARSADRGESIAAEIVAEGGEAIFMKTDVSEPESVEASFATISDRFGHLDVLFNNAGGSSSADGALTVAPLEEFWRCIKLDLFGTWLCSRAAIPLMQKSGGGSIINSASIVGEMGIPNRDAYTAAKGGIIALTRSMAVEFAKDGIRVNVVIPGAVMTPRVAAFFQREPHLKKQEEAYLLGFADPIDVANAALFLASDESRRTTGQKLPVDSGILIS
jgi:NAD(P)-dependent dehydrogenase (short-subunit alcohol dehydrogenase family)